MPVALSPIGLHFGRRLTRMTGLFYNRSGVSRETGQALSPMGATGEVVAHDFSPTTGRRAVAMRPGGWFGTVSKSLADGFFADKVVLALARVKRDSTVSQEQRELFSRAAKFLTDAISGYEWVDNPRFTGDSAKHASLFGQVVRAMTITSAPANFVAHLGQLRDVAQKLAEGGIPEANEINYLRQFFSSHSRAEMEHSDRLFETTRGRGGSAWGPLA